MGMDRKPETNPRVCLCGHVAKQHLPLRGPCKHRNNGDFCPCARLDEVRTVPANRSPFVFAPRPDLVRPRESEVQPSL